MAAVAAAQAQEAVRQDAAFEEGVKLVFDKLRQVGAGSVFGLGEERRGVLLNQAVQRGLLRAVARVVDRSAITMRLSDLVSVGLHALGMENLGWCSFSGRAGQSIRLWGDHLLPAPQRRPCSGAVPCPGAPPPAMRWRPLRDGIPSTTYPTIRDGAFHARAKPSDGAGQADRCNGQEHFGQQGEPSPSVRSNSADIDLTG